MAARVPLILNQTTARVEELAAADTLLAGTIEGLLGRNRIINGDMGIWQRGTSFTAPGYTSDRWYFNAGGVNSPSLTRNPITPGSFSGIEAPALAKVSYGTITDATNHFVVYEQLIENVTTFAGATVTISFKVFNSGAAGRQIAVEVRQNFGTGGSATVSGIGSQKFSLVAGINVITLSVAIPSVSGKTVGANNSLGFAFWATAGSAWNSRSASLGAQTGDVHFTEVQIEQGAGATLFGKRLPMLELALCLRYYEKSYNLDVVPGSIAQAGRVNQFFNQTQGGPSYGEVRYTVRKRIPASVVVYASETGTLGRTSGSNGIDSTSTTISANGETGFGVTTVNAALNFGLSFHWTSDAEL